MGRPSLGHTRSLALKLHPDLFDHVQRQAATEYCTPAEYVRRLIITDLKMLSDKSDT